jgi:predicted TIM-barrel fold metal-dependent hydrolase
MLPAPLRNLLVLGLLGACASRQPAPTTPVAPSSPTSDANSAWKGTPPPPDAKGVGRAKTPSALDAIPVRYRVTDAHFHFLDFLQQTDGIEAAVAAMDKSNIDHAMITGMPLVKKWDKEEPRRPLYYLEDDGRAYWYSATDVAVARALQLLPVATRLRFHPFISGFNPTDRNAIDHVERLMEWYPGLWEGIGEVMGRHDDLTALTYGETSRPNSIAMDPVYDFAAEHDMPVSVHSNIGSVWVREPIYMHEIDEMVSKHPKTRFIWCHAGISRRIVITNLVPELRKMLLKHKNLWIDISWVVFEDYIAPDGVPSPEWLRLFTDFPDRFMIGSDKVARFATLDREIKKYYVVLDALPPAVAQKIAHDNFLSILPARVRERLKTEVH